MKNEKWMGIAAVSSALAASLCCVGPTLFIALGIGGLGGFSVFDKYRPIFMAITLAVLGVAFYLTYRKRPVPCEDGSCKTSNGSPKAKAALWGISVIAVGLMASPYMLAAVSRTQAAAPIALASDSYDSVKLDIEGMTCESCVSHIQTKLKEVPGVLDASVDYASKSAVIRCEKGSKNTSALLKAVKTAGYEAQVSL